MTKRVRVRAIRRPEVEDDRLAVAFLMLAKILDEQAESEDAEAERARPDANSGEGTT